MIRGALSTALLLALAGHALALPLAWVGPKDLVQKVQQRNDFTWQPPVYDLGTTSAPSSPIVVVTPTAPTPPVIVEPPKPQDPSGSWAYQWWGSGIGPSLHWMYRIQCTLDRVTVDASQCGARPAVLESCIRGMVNTNQGDTNCTPGYSYLHTYRYEGTLMGTPKDSSLWDVDASGNPMGSSGKPAIFNPAGKGF